MTTACASKAKVRRPHVALRRAATAAQRQHRQTVERIVSAGGAREAAAAAAATITNGHLSEAEVLAWRQDLNARLDVLMQHPEQNMGFIEEAVALAGKELMRQSAERACQAKANATPCCCPEHHSELTGQKCLRRVVDGRFGSMTLFRGYGWCSQCEQWYFPADHALGLERNAPASPYLQEISALLTTKMPPEQAVLVAQRLGLDLSRCFLHREAHRQGLKAQSARAGRLAQLDSWEGIQSLAAHGQGPPTQPFSLIIEIDAWNIRERDEWGRTEEIREQGQKPPSRWHWVYIGTVFRLDHRVEGNGKRALISERGYAATREGVDALIRQLHREAVQRGLGRAAQVLVIADGAAWIWNAVQDRFKNAHQRLDLWHADEHLWEVAHDLHGKGTPEARNWVAPLLKQIRDDQTLQVIQSLGELKPQLTEVLQEKIQKQIDYFDHHRNRMNYKEIIEARKARDKGEATPEQLLKAQTPLGSGAIESTCRQYQCRFKRTGQFWSTAGDEALMCLETFWRNDRWDHLYPHAKTSTTPSPALN
jgi:hypothetical protein